MIEYFDYKKEGFDAIITNEGWKVAYLTYSDEFDKLVEIKRHTLTDEVFVLLSGKANLFVADDGENLTKIPMEKNKVYNVKRNTWHHTQLSKKAVLLVVENSNTTKENTDCMLLSEYNKRR